MVQYRLCYLAPFALIFSNLQAFRRSVMVPVHVILAAGLIFQVNMFGIMNDWSCSLYMFLLFLLNSDICSSPACLRENVLNFSMQTYVFSELD